MILSHFQHEKPHKVRYEPRYTSHRKLRSHSMLDLESRAQRNPMTFRIVYPHIEKEEGQSARLQRLPRIRVAQIVMDYLAYGWSVEEICRQHPYLRFSEAYAAMGYYFDYQQEIDTEIRGEWEQALQEKAQVATSPFVVRMRTKGLL